MGGGGRAKVRQPEQAGSLSLKGGKDSTPGSNLEPCNSTRRPRDCLHPPQAWGSLWGWGWEKVKGRGQKERTDPSGD